MAGGASRDDARWGSSFTEDGRQTVRVAAVVRQLAESKRLPTRAAVRQVLGRLSDTASSAYFLRHPGDFADELLDNDVRDLLRVSGARTLASAGFLQTGELWWWLPPGGGAIRAKELPQEQGDTAAAVFVAGDQLLKVARTPDLRGVAGLVECLALAWARVVDLEELDIGPAAMVAVHADVPEILGVNIDAAVRADERAGSASTPALAKGMARAVELLSGLPTLPSKPKADRDACILAQFKKLTEGDPPMLPAERAWEALGARWRLAPSSVKAYLRDARKA